MPTPLPLLIDADTLNAELGRDDLIILDLSSENIYAQAHVPGAIHISPRELVSGIQPATGSLPGRGIAGRYSAFEHVQLVHVHRNVDEGP